MAKYREHKEKRVFHPTPRQSINKENLQGRHGTSSLGKRVTTIRKTCNLSFRGYTMSKETLLKEGHALEAKFEALLEELREWLAKLESL